MLHSLPNISIFGHLKELNGTIYLRKGQYAQPCVKEQDICEDRVLRYP
jgi:hypothetical protein